MDARTDFELNTNNTDSAVVQNFSIATVSEENTAYSNAMVSDCKLDTLFERATSLNVSLCALITSK